MEGIEQITDVLGRDQLASLWMNSFNSPWSDQFWIFMSGRSVWVPFYLAIAALLLWRLGWKRGLVAIACILLAFFFNERVNNLIKHLVCRVRPCNNSDMIAAGLHILESGGGWSFPSGHACNTFGLALSSALCLKMDKRANWTWFSVLIISWATLVGISRVMVARHYLGDVLVGSFNGAMMGILWAWIAKLICDKYFAEN